MAVNEKGLTTLQMKAVPLILASKTITEGVKKAGTTRETFYQWMRDDEFKGEFIRQRQELVDIALHALNASAVDAVKVMRDLLSAEGESVRLRAAQTILDNIFKSIEFENIEKRIDEIERRLE
jgi:hypothetical protein